MHVGTYPIYEVSARLIDGTALKRLATIDGGLTLDSIHTTEIREQLGTVHPNDISQNMYSKELHFQGDLLPVALPPETERQEYSIRFAARNGMWFQDVVIEAVNGRFLVAYRVCMADPSKVLVEHIDPGLTDSTRRPAAAVTGSRRIGEVLTAAPVNRGERGQVRGRTSSGDTKRVSPAFIVDQRNYVRDPPSFGAPYMPRHTRPKTKIRSEVHSFRNSTSCILFLKLVPDSSRHSQDPRHT